MVQTLGCRRFMSCMGVTRLAQSPTFRSAVAVYNRTSDCLVLTSSSSGTMAELAAAADITLYSAGTPNGQCRVCLGAASIAGKSAAAPPHRRPAALPPDEACCRRRSLPPHCAGWKASICLEELGLQVRCQG